MRDNDVPPGRKEKKLNDNSENPEREQSILNRENEIEKDIKEVEREDKMEEEEEDVQWDGSEAERVIDDDAEEYEEDTTGIKIGYKLCMQEAYDGLRKSRFYNKKNGEKKLKTFLSILMILVFIAFFAFTGIYYNLIFTLVMILYVVGIWALPVMKLKKVIRDMFLDKEISLEIFPDKIDVSSDGVRKEIILDGKCSYEEVEDVMIINSGKDVLVIPVRCIEPEFLPDVQENLVARAQPVPKNRD